MSRRWLINIGLISLVFGLSYYVSKNPVDTQPRKLTSLTAEQIDTIVIQRADGSEFIFENDTSGWFLRSPTERLANSQSISSILDLVTLKSRYRHTLKKESERNRYELDQPKVTLFLNDQQFDFGGINPFNQQRYVLHDGTVHTLPDTIFPSLTLPLSQFVYQY